MTFNSEFLDVQFDVSWKWSIDFNNYSSVYFWLDAVKYLVYTLSSKLLNVLVVMSFSGFVGIHLPSWTGCNLSQTCILIRIPSVAHMVLNDVGLYGTWMKT